MTKTKLSLLLLALLAVVACETPVDASLENAGPLSTSTMSASKNASSALLNSNAKHWSELSETDFWNYILSSDSTVVIGLKLPGSAKGVDEGRILVQGSTKENLIQQVKSLPGVRFISTDSVLPAVVAKVTNLNAVRGLRNSPFVEYVEPYYMVATTKDEFWQDESEWTCDSETYNPTGTVSPGDHYSWTLGKHEVKDGWIYSNGSGITVGVVDTGVGAAVTQLNSEFAAGMSSGRTITKEWIAGSSWDDDCGHGTKVAGILAAPSATSQDIFGNGFA